MTKKELKQGAQDNLMHWLSNGVLASSESGESKEVIEEMKIQARRVGKMFGYQSWPGLGVFDK